MELVNVKKLNQSQWKSYYSLYNTLSKNSKYSKKYDTIYSGNNTKNFYISRVNESIGMKPDRKEYEYKFTIK